MKLSKLLLIPFSIVCLSSANATPVPVDLTGWGKEGAGTWSVQSGNDSVLQTINRHPTVFFEAGSSSLNTALSGSIEVQTTSDDDFIGFVLGYQAGELNSAASDFWLIDWKQTNQSVNGHLGNEGLALSHVTNASQVNAYTDFWSHSGGVREVARATNLGSTGWADNTEYLFDLVFTDDLIQVYVNDALELNVTAGQAGVSQFNDGAFGFYNYSQSTVLYAGIEESQASDFVNVPEPSIIALFGAGILGLSFARRRKLRQS